jgi:hypothetical protein
MKILKVKDLKRARKHSIKVLREEKLDRTEPFKELLEKATDLYVKGFPRMEYELKKSLVEKHMRFWLYHPVWNQCIGSVIDKPHNKSNVMVSVYFRN